MKEYCDKQWMLQEYERQRASGSVSFRNIIENAPTETLLPEGTAWRHNDTPPDEQKVLVWTRSKKGVNNLLVGYYSPELQRWCIGMNTNVIAWRPRPSDAILDIMYKYIIEEAGA